MGKNTDWMPTTREGRLAMVKRWLLEAQTNATRWKIPDTAVQELSAKASEAENLLNLDLSAERTKTIAAQCKAAFVALVAAMRDFKRRYFLSPPLTAADFISLGLKPPHHTSSPQEAPTAQAEADLTFPGLHMVELKNIRPVGKTQGEEGSDSGVRIYYGLTGEPTTIHKFRLQSVPTRGNELPYSEWASKRKFRFDFDGESGNTVYFCLRYENSKGMTGPFGPLLKAVIP